MTLKQPSHCSARRCRLIPRIRGPRHNLQVLLNARVPAEPSAQPPWDRHGLESTVPAGAPLELPQPMPRKADWVNGAALAGVGKA